MNAKLLDAIALLLGPTARAKGAAILQQLDVAVVRRAYRVLAVSTHPDAARRGGGRPDGRLFIEASRAYELLMGYLLGHPSPAGRGAGSRTDAPRGQGTRRPGPDRRGAGEKPKAGEKSKTNERQGPGEGQKPGDKRTAGEKRHTEQKRAGEKRKTEEKGRAAEPGQARGAGRAEGSAQARGTGQPRSGQARGTGQASGGGQARGTGQGAGGQARGPGQPRSGGQANASGSSRGAALFYHGPVPRRKLRLAEFLYYTGRISWQSLISAIVWQRATQPKFGELAREMKSISGQDLAKILGSRLRHEQTGQTAQRLRLLSAKDVERILRLQRARHRLIGRYFVEKESMPRDALSGIMRELFRHNARYGRPA